MLVRLCVCKRLLLQLACNSGGCLAGYLCPSETMTQIVKQCLAHRLHAIDNKGKKNKTNEINRKKMRKPP